MFVKKHILFYNLCNVQNLAGIYDGVYFSAVHFDTTPQQQDCLPASIIITQEEREGSESMEMGFPS